MEKSELFNGGFMSDPHSQYRDTILVFKVRHVIALRTDFQLLEEIKGYFILGWATKNSRKLA